MTYRENHLANIRLLWTKPIQRLHLVYQVVKILQFWRLP